MVDRLLACPACSRHARAVERSCPFCEVRFPEARMGKVALGVAISTGLVFTCCSVYGAPGPYEEAVDAGSDARDASRADTRVGVSDCTPGDVSTFVPAWKVPTAFHQGACADAQGDALIGCLTNVPDAATCKTFFSDPANKACLACAVTPSTAPKYGPLVEGVVTISVNAAGCIADATGDVSASGCGARVLAADQCDDFACEAKCPIPPNDDGSAYVALLACRMAAGTSVCKSYSEAASCSRALTGVGGVAEECSLPGTSFAENAKAMVKLFCGSATTDGGPADSGSDG
jgi:hypothetical protein